MKSAHRIFTYILVFFITCIFLNSCSRDEQHYLKYVLEGVSFNEALDKAKSENKLLWVIIGDSYDTRHSSRFLNTLSRKGIFKKYAPQFVFYACNIKENEQYYFILRPSSIPNSYVFNNNGELLSAYDYSEDKEKFAIDQLKQFSNPENVKENRREELKFLNIAIKAANYLNLEDSEDSLQKAKDLLDNIDDNSLDYYTAYLKTQISLKLNDSISTGKYADIAFEKYNSDPNPLLYLQLNDRIKDFSEKYKLEKATKPYISFEKQRFDCGKVKKGKEFTIKIKYKNEGVAPLVIFQTVVSCSCIKVDCPSNAIVSGESAECSFKYDPTEKGFFIRTVYFESNASNRFEKIILEGQVI